MSPNALALVDQVLAGYEGYTHYLAVERYYTTGNTGPTVTVYLSRQLPVLMSQLSMMVGPGIRVDAYTTTGTNVGAQRLTVANVAASVVVSWGVQELVVSDCKPTQMGGVLYDVPASYVRQNNQADMAGALAAAITVMLVVAVLVALYSRLFRVRG